MINAIWVFTTSITWLLFISIWGRGAWSSLLWPLRKFTNFSIGFSCIMLASSLTMGLLISWLKYLPIGRSIPCWIKIYFHSTYDVFYTIMRGEGNDRLRILWHLWKVRKLMLTQFGCPVTLSRWSKVSGGKIAVASINCCSTWFLEALVGCTWMWWYILIKILGIVLPILHLGMKEILGWVDRVVKLSRLIVECHIIDKLFFLSL